MDEFDFFLGGADPADPLMLGGDMFQQATGGSSPYRYTGRYGTLLNSYEVRSRLQSRQELRTHMMRYEAQRITAQATAILNSGAQGITDTQREILQEFANNNVTTAGLQSLSMLGVDFGLDAGRSALGIEESLRFGMDPMTGLSGMNAKRRAMISSYVATDMYRPGEGRAFAGGLSGIELGTVSQLMARQGQLTGGAQINREIDQFLETDPRVLPGGQFGRSVNPVEAERLDEIRNLAIMRTATQDPTLNDEELKNASAAYEEAMNRAIGKRIAQGLRDKARAVGSMQRHFRTVEGEDIAIEEAYAMVEEMLGPNANTGVGRASMMVEQLSQLSRSSGMSMRQIQALRARGAQFADAMGLGSSNIGASLTMQTGNFIATQSADGVFNQPIFGIGDRDTEAMEDAYGGAAYAASGILTAQAGLLRLDTISPEGLQDGTVKDIITKMKAGQQLSTEEYELLRNPTRLVQEMMAASPGMDSSYAFSLIEDQQNAKGMLYYDPETMMANRRNLQNNDIERKIRQFSDAAAKTGLGKGAMAGPLDAEQQSKAIQATIDKFRNATPEDAKWIDKGTGSAALPRGLELTKSALLEARARKEISFEDEELDKLARITFTQAQDVTGQVATAFKKDSAAELLIDINEKTQRLAMRKDKADAALARMQTMTGDYAGESGIAGIMALFEGADKNQEGVDFAQIGAAILSGASDDKQAAILRDNRDTIMSRFNRLKKVREDNLRKGGLTEEEAASLEDDIAVAGTIIDHIDKVLQFDEKGKPGGEGGSGDGEVTEYGPGGGESGDITMTNVTLVINDAEVGRNLSASGKGAYGGRFAVPVTKVT